MQETYVLRKFELEDLQAVIKINQTCLPENYSDFFFVDLFRRFPETFLVADVGGEIVGYIMCRIEVGLPPVGLKGLIKKGHVVSVAVLEEHRKKGIGTALVNKAMEAMKMYGAKQCYLEVRVTNEAAINLYKKLGLEVTRTISGYYADGEDAYLMSKKL
ncbi:MAG: ribosomal protein S18-alanine N-acetyltransferase [Candidatus Bathyarchaeia archaeon]